MNLPPGTEGIRLRKPTNTTETPFAAKKPRHTGLLQDQLRRSARAPWCPNLSAAFRMLVLIRVAAATWSNIQDCDEVFNFWEPLHYLDQGHGFQTWETSPTYALRSWAYILMHIFPAKFPIWIASFDKRHTFFGLRMIFAFASSFCEAKLFRTVAEHVNDRVGRYMLFMLMFNAGMWNASTAFLPSTFAMYAATAAASFSFIPPSSSRVQRTFAATLLFATGAIIGWPFSLLLAVPFVIEELTVYGGDVVPSSALPKWIENRWKYLFGSGAVAASLFIPVTLIDTYAYGRLTLTPWNIVRYNIFSGSSGRSPNLYGTEPWYYYIFNLILNFNILAPLALGSLPALLVTKRFDSKRLGVFSGPVGQTSSPYTLLAIRLAPFYLWFTTLTFQAHKEERFLYPVYPLVCFNAAVTLYLVRGWMETAYIKATNSPYRAANTNIFRLTTLSAIVLTSALSISRIVALFKYYHAPLDVAFHFQYEELPRLLNTTGLLAVPDPTLKKHASKYDESAPVDLSLVRQFGLRVCWGAEWYRFPGSYLVPSGVEPLLVESGFDGMLPRPFPAVVPITDPSPVGKSSFEPVKIPLKPSSGLFGELSRTLGRTTRLIPSGFNDLNRAEEGQAADPAECDYFVHLRFPHSPERQEPVPSVGLWEDVACFPFLDAQRSSIMSRVFWVPGSVWQRGNTFGEYCLLREKERAQIRERETKWSKTA
ncbi:alpha-1,2-mannosyltransferase [Rhizoctonia solani]|uniref:Mannosyltransferase n=1 Tax=Rhizoctonia solani TaxID=456999 RepID=A0A0K6FNE5_9AGAM|nr:alpha-1,2-mannosyltransferase [Rhizoctonia solani]